MAGAWEPGLFRRWAVAEEVAPAPELRSPWVRLSKKIPEMAEGAEQARSDEMGRAS